MPSDFLDEMELEKERENAALNSRLEYLEQEADDRLSSRNGMLADVSVATERGVFKREWIEGVRSGELDIAKGPEWTEEMEKGFIVRTRTAALTSQLNSADALDRICEMQKQLEHLFYVATFCACALIVLLINLFWK